jgi:hypothetical protein
MTNRLFSCIHGSPADTRCDLCDEPETCSCFPHGPDDPCTCDGFTTNGDECFCYPGHVVGCTCDIAWDCEHRHRQS